MDGAFEPRLEDYRLLTGAGNFQDDEATAGAAWGVFVRSPHAFADIRGIDTASAQAVPGVLAVLTAAALDATGIGSVSVPVPVPGSPGMVSPHRPSLARDCVRHVGDPVALVVAGSEAEARDAAELVEVDYAARDAVTDVVRAAAPGAPQIWPEGSGNIAVDWHPYGAKSEDRVELDRIFAGAAHIASVRLVNQRIVMAPMEPRACVAVYEPETDRYVLHVAVGGKSDAVVNSVGALEYEISTYFSGVIPMPSGLLAPSYMAFALPPNSPLKKSLDRALIEITASASWRALEHSYFGR